MSTSHPLRLEPANNEWLANLCGQFDSHLRQIERRLGLQIHNRGHEFNLIGAAEVVERAAALLQALYLQANEPLSADQLHLALQQADNASATLVDQNEHQPNIRTRKGLIRARGRNQQNYLNAILHNDISFGVGPAGTGKTYLAVACAVEALERDEVRRILLTRPAVEAGERLGFLPGDLSQKVDPYLRPLYDALHEMLGFEKVARLIERQVIEIAPLAYMRGRTLNESFIILDEAQNTTCEQMKMFLTRIGFGTRAVITGDITQVDLPRGQASGLRQAIDVLQTVKGIHFTFFQAQDVVRHPVVQRIVMAYERFDQQQST